MEKKYQNVDQRCLFTYEELDFKPVISCRLVQICSPREVFAPEMEPEDQILKDSEAHLVVGERVGIEVTQVLRQVSTTRALAQRMDLVASSLNPADPAIVVELRLGSLDIDYVLRGISYAQVFNSPHLILVTSDFPEQACNFLDF